MQQDLAPQGLGLKVFDCYRPTRAVAHFVRWARDVKDVKRKADFYPDVDKRDLFRLGYISHALRPFARLDRRPHAGAAARHGQPPAEVDMGTRFDFFGVQSWPSSRGRQRGGAGEPQDSRHRDAARRLHGPTTRNGGTSRCAASRIRARYFDFPVR